MGIVFTSLSQTCRAKKRLYKKFWSIGGSHEIIREPEPQIEIQKNITQEVIVRSPDQISKLQNFEGIFRKKELQEFLRSLSSKSYPEHKQNNSSYFAGFSIHDENDSDYQLVKQIFQDYKKKSWEKQVDNKLNKGIATFLGNAIGDALGAHTEFINFNNERNEIEQNWESLKQWAIKFNHQRSEFGVITDDCSMARCMADSILSNNIKFNPIDMRMRFLLWWNTGYCNGSKNGRSFGLGGNIAQGFQSFFPKCQPYVVSNKTQRGNVQGNGSIMRLSPIPIAYHDDIEKGEQIAVLQSLTTHDGDEAAELCKLLTHLVIKLINYEGINAKRDIFDKLGETFQTNNKAVKAMACSQQEPKENMTYHDSQYNWSIKDRYWDWKNDELYVSPCRSMSNPGYFGSYAMDGCYVALHIAYHSSSFTEAVFKAVNWGGDSDSIASVVGYICGAMYGISVEMIELYVSEMVQHEDYSTIVKAMKLFNKTPIQTDAKYIPQEDNQDEQLI